LSRAKQDTEGGVPACREGQWFDPAQLHQIFTNAVRLYPSKRKHESVLCWMCKRSSTPSGGTSSRPGDFDQGTWTVELGVSGTICHVERSAAAREPAEELEVASLHSGTDRCFQDPQLSAPRRSRGGRRFDPDQVHQISLLNSYGEDPASAKSSSRNSPISSFVAATHPFPRPASR